jgi:hypothetical protein
MCSLLGAGTLFAADPMVGTWKINIEKSKLRNPAAWKGRSMIIEQVASDTFRITFILPNANGGVDRRVDIRSPKENPVDGSPGETSVQQKIDEHHRRTIFKRNGTEVGKLESAISPDGKTTTNTISGVGNDGKPFEEVRVWDKQ